MSDSTGEAPVLYAVNGGVARITLNRPSSLNAINGAMHHGIHDYLDQAAADDDVRVVVLSGAGRAFSAGGDLKAVAAGENVGDPSVLGLAIWNLPKPVIAAVHGYCLGQAYEIAAICDLTIATVTAKFGEVEINHGASPPILITPYLLGMKHAREVVLLGEILDAQWALRTGLANRVVPDDQLEVEVAKVTDRLVGLSAAALAKNKRLVNATYEMTQFVDALTLSRRVH